MTGGRVARELGRVWAQLRKAALKARLGQRWGSTGDGPLVRRDYPDYETYLEHQRLKLDALRERSIAGHDRRFHAALSERLAASPEPVAGRSVLCLAARIGTEVRAFIDQGAFAVGVDLNPGKSNRWVVVGDFHALQFADRSVDLVYSNSLDHAFDLERVMAEVRRVLKDDGTLVLEIGAGSEEGGGAGFYESLTWSRVDHLLERIAALGFAVRRRTPFELPWKGEHVVLARADPPVSAPPASAGG